MIKRLRERFGLLDHLFRMHGRYQADTGDRLAAAVTFYWFLSLFPILLLVLAGYGYLHSGESAAQLNSRLGRDLGGFLPGQLITTLTDTLATAKGKAGVIGLAGLLLAGLGWIDALRGAIRTIWHKEITARNVIIRKLVDIVVLVGLFATIAASVFVTGLAGSGPKLVLEQFGVDKTAAATLFLLVVGFLLGALVDVALFLYLFVRLARAPMPVRDVLKGAVLGAIGFGILKLVGGFYVRHTTTSGEATYGTFAVVVGLLLFLNLVSRLVLYAAAFAVTASPHAPAEEAVPLGCAPMTTQALLEGFYDAFARKDGDAMTAAYAPGATFSDPVFVGLKDGEPGAMWRMLTSRSKDLTLELVSCTADESSGSAHWIAHYTFAQTGRPVVNNVQSRFTFANGLIVDQQDDFDFHSWAGQALGLSGKLLGGTPVIRNAVRRKARAGLDAFLSGR